MIGHMHLERLLIAEPLHTDRAQKLSMRALVPAQLDRILERFVTLQTRGGQFGVPHGRLLRRVFPLQMRSQAVHAGEDCVAQIARNTTIGVITVHRSSRAFLAGRSLVHLFVASQQTALRERRTALVAHERPFAGVHTFVQTSRVLQLEPFRAIGAGERERFALVTE